MLTAPQKQQQQQQQQDERNMLPHMNPKTTPRGFKNFGSNLWNRSKLFWLYPPEGSLNENSTATNLFPRDNGDIGFVLVHNSVSNGGVMIFFVISEKLFIRDNQATETSFHFKCSDCLLSGSTGPKT